MVQGSLAKGDAMRFRAIIAAWAALMLVSGPAASQNSLRCLIFNGTADGLVKPRAVEDSLASLREAIDKWKSDNKIAVPVTEKAEKPQPHPYWRSSIAPELMLPPDVVSDAAYTICWKGVVSPVVCTSGARVCW